MLLVTVPAFVLCFSFQFFGLDMRGGRDGVGAMGNMVVATRV